MTTSKIKVSGGWAGLALAVMLMVLAQPARAADPIYPTSSRIGLVPPTGMEPSKTFPGFQDVARNAAIIMTTLPAAAYSELERTIVADALKKEGVTVDKREPVQLSAGTGFLIVGTHSTDKTRYAEWLLVAAAGDLTALVRVQVQEGDDLYTDAVVRASLATLAVRATVPDQERLSLLPFTIGDLAGFHIEEVLPGRALTLVDHGDGLLNARMAVAAFAGGPGESDDRGNFARLIFQEIGGIKDVHLTMSEPLRIGGQPGFQTMAQAKDVLTGSDLMVAQWLRFTGGGFLQMVGMGRADNWVSILTRLRAVRDSVGLK